jgi:hypothetical protein
MTDELGFPTVDIGVSGMQELSPLVHVLSFQAGYFTFLVARSRPLSPVQRLNEFIEEVLLAEILQNIVIFSMKLIAFPISFCE